MKKETRNKCWSHQNKPNSLIFFGTMKMNNVKFFSCVLLILHIIVIIHTNITKMTAMFSETINKPIDYVAWLYLVFYCNKIVVLKTVQKCQEFGKLKWPKDKLLENSERALYFKSRLFGWKVDNAEKFLKSCSCGLSESKKLKSW